GAARPHPRIQSAHLRLEHQGHRRLPRRGRHIAPRAACDWGGAGHSRPGARLGRWRDAAAADPGHRSRARAAGDQSQRRDYKRLLGKDQVDLIQLRVDDIYDAPRIAQSIPAILGPNYVTQDWAEMNRSLFSALGLEKIAISLTIGLIVMVAALNIVASLILLV